MARNRRSLLSAPPMPLGKSPRCYRWQIHDGLSQGSSRLFATRVFVPDQSVQKRLPDRSEPWASGACQAILLHLLPKIICNSLTYSFEHASQSECARRQDSLKVAALRSCGRSSNGPIALHIAVQRDRLSGSFRGLTATSVSGYAIA